MAKDIDHRGIANICLYQQLQSATGFMRSILEVKEEEGVLVTAGKERLLEIMVQFGCEI